MKENPKQLSPSAGAAWSGLVSFEKNDWGLLQVQGKDAATFLHGQLTQEVLHLNAQGARLATYCSVKGRVLATFLLMRQANTAEGEPSFLLLTAHSTLAAVLKRLQLFVLRAKVRLTEVSEDWSILGLVGQAAETFSLEPKKPSPGPLDAYHQFALPKGAVCVQLPSVEGLNRALWLGPASVRPAVAPVLNSGVWHWLQIRAGLAWVEAAWADAFVPQMLNYESLGVVNFQKGCYPGQEVVARSQFRGQIKRRTFIVRSPVALQPQQEIWHTLGEEAAQACGQVLQVAAVPEAAGLGQGFEALACLQVSATEEGRLHLQDPALALEVLPLPYRWVDI